MAFGAILSEIDGSEFEYEIKENTGLPTEYSYKFNLPNVLNQGAKPICVPCSISSWLNWKVNISEAKNSDNKFDLDDIFKGGGGTYDKGMTCKEAFKYIINNGAKYKKGLTSISKYYKISSLYSLRHAIVTNGPCIAVLPVFSIDIDDFWIKGPDFLGYHAVSIVGYNKDGFIIRNSWGSTYGVDGYSYISENDINRLAVEIWTLC